MITTQPRSVRKNISVALTKTQEHRLRFQLRLLACSEAWVADSIREVVRDEVAHRYFDPRVFPPGGRHGTRMKWCRCCGRFTPPNGIHLVEYRHGRAGETFASSLQCDDCRIGENEERYRELYEAGLHLRPAGSQSFVSRAGLRASRARGD